jgi:hypothetical protein
MCAYIVWAISPHFLLHPHPLPSLPPCFQAEPVLPSSPILLKRKRKRYYEKHSIFARLR